MPEKSGECVIRYYEMRDGELGVGDTLNLSSGTDTAITDSTLNDDTYTIVGKVTTPYYLSYQYDSASVGNGKVEYLMYIPLDEFKGNLLYKDSGYSVIYAAIDGAAALDTYSDEYFDLTDPVKERVKELGENTMEKLAAGQMIPSDGSIPLNGMCMTEIHIFHMWITETAETEWMRLPRFFRHSFILSLHLYVSQR